MVVAKVDLVRRPVERELQRLRRRRLVAVQVAHQHYLHSLRHFRLTPWLTVTFMVFQRPDKTINVAVNNCYSGRISGKVIASRILTPVSSMTSRSTPSP